MLLKYEKAKKQFLAESKKVSEEEKSTEETGLEKHRPSWYAGFSDPGTFPKHINMPDNSCDDFMRIIDDIEKRRKDRTEKRIAKAIQEGQEPEIYRPVSSVSYMNALKDLILNSQGIKVIGAYKNDNLLQRVEFLCGYRKIPTKDFRIMLLLDDNDNIRAILEYRSNGTPFIESTVTFVRRFSIEQFRGNRMGDKKVSFLVRDNGKIVYKINSVEINEKNYMELVGKTRNEAEHWLIYEYPKILKIEGDFSSWRNLDAYR